MPQTDNDKPITMNASYRPLSLEKLLLLDSFVHIKPEILRQGRVCYFDGKSLLESRASGMSNSDSDGEESDLEAINNDRVSNKFITPEVPVPLFASCSNDRWTNDNKTPPWTIQLSDVVEDAPFVLLQSNVWPGAFSFAKER